MRIPVRVRPKSESRTEQVSSFTVYLSTCRDSGHRPIFQRDGIVTADVRLRLMPGTRSLVVVDDASLAELLGDAEGVNHTQWQKDSPKFHNRSVYGPETIKFVSRSVFEITQRMRAAETKGDPDLLLDIFYLPSDEGLDERRKTPLRGKPDIPPPPPPTLPPPKPKPFALGSLKGGFSLRPGNVPFASLPVKLRIEAGYAVRHGMREDFHRYFFATVFARKHGRSPLLEDFPRALLPKHSNVAVALKKSMFNDRFRVQLANRPSTTIVSHIAKDGHYYIHYDPAQCRSRR